MQERVRQVLYERNAITTGVLVWDYAAKDRLLPIRGLLPRRAHGDVGGLRTLHLFSARQQRQTECTRKCSKLALRQFLSPGGERGFSTSRPSFCWTPDRLCQPCRACDEWFTAESGRLRERSHPAPASANRPRPARSPRAESSKPRRGDSERHLLRRHCRPPGDTRRSP